MSSRKRDAFAPERVGQGIGVHARGHQPVLPAEKLEHLKNRGRIAARGGHVAKAGLVGACLLGAAVGEQRAFGRLSGAGGDGEAGRGVAAHCRRSGADHADQRHAARALHRLIAAGRMAAGDASRFMGDHGAQLVDRLEPGEKSGVEEDVLPARHEGVQIAVIDDVDVHRGRAETGGAEDRVGDLLQRALDLGVADEALGRGRRHGDGEHEPAQHEYPQPQRSPPSVAPIGKSWLKRAGRGRS